MGCVAAVVFHNGRTGRAGAILLLGVCWFAAGVALEAYGVTNSPHDPRQRVLVFGVPAALFVYGLAARERHGAALLPAWLRPLGDASYSTYLTHGAAHLGCSCATALRGRARVSTHVALLGLQLVVSCVVGHLYYLGVERPLLNWCRPRPAPKPAPAADETLLRRAA